MPLFLRAAALKGKTEASPDKDDPRYGLPTQESAAEAESILLPLIQLTDGRLVADPSTLPGGIVDRWERLALLGGTIAPSVWTRHLQMPPEQLLGLDCDQMTQKYFKESWRTAAIRYRDESWVSALSKDPFFYEMAHEMFNRFPIATRERLSLEMVASNDNTWRSKGAKHTDQPIINSIRGLTFDWSEEFASALLPNLQREVDDPLPEISEYTLHSAAIYFPVSLHSKFPAYEKFRALLEMKADIYKVL